MKKSLLIAVCTLACFLFPPFGGPKGSFAQSYDSININNINARINAGGVLFENMDLAQAAFEVPKGSGKHTIFNAELWIGGKDDNGILHMAGQLYGGYVGDTNFWPGPIMDSVYYSDAEDLVWDRVWKINKSDIDYHIDNWANPNYTPPQSLVDWPGNGDPAKGQAAILAPFFDRLGDQVYEPAEGDYPLIPGDQAVYFVYNDDRKPHQNGGQRLQVEVHGIAYAYNCNQDSALYNTVFVHYKVVNRSSNTYDSTFIGVNYDMDIGNIDDDYIECDVARGSIFGFNGDSIDGFGNSGDYGVLPPAQALTFLKGPKLPEDSLDNAKGQCNESINGYGFGDGITDNECYGMTHFKSYCVPGCGILNQSDPSTAMDFYNYLKGNWNDGTRVKHGGFGSSSTCSSCEDAGFMYPNNTDACNWGTNGIIPADTVSWTEANAGISPNDKRGLGSMGPIEYKSGDTIEIDIAFVFGRNYTDTTGDPSASIVTMKNRVDSVRAYFEKNITPCGDAFDEIFEDQPSEIKMTLSPNPASAVINVDVMAIDAVERYEIYNLMGERVLFSDQINKIEELGSITISVKHLRKGVYILRLNTAREAFYNKFIKM